VRLNPTNLTPVLIPLLNEIFILQTVTFFTLFFFVNAFNIVSIWYLAGIYLTLLGC